MQSLIDAGRNSGQQASGILYLTPRREDSVSATAIPLKNSAGNVLAVLTVAISRSGLVEEQQHIRAIAYGVASGGILLAIVFSLWIAARVSRPIEQLARAAEEVASGNWDARVPERGRDEVSVLARSFNHMTEQLDEPARTAGAERTRGRVARTGAAAGARAEESAVSAAADGREPGARARNCLRRSSTKSFSESTQTLSMEIANLKTIIGRFSDFSKMPKPELERIDAKDVVARVRALYATQAARTGRRSIRETDVDDEPMPLDG